MTPNTVNPAADTSYPEPPTPNTQDGKPRRMGIEVEVGGISLETVLSCVQRTLGGTVEVESQTEGRVKATGLGEFKIEFDQAALRSRSYMKPLERLGIIEGPDSERAQRLEESLLSLAAEVVPVEIVAPPIEWTRLAELDPLWRSLREEGARDTHGSVLYAFGCQINAEVPSEDSATVLGFLRAFLVLEDWLVRVSKIDLSRRVSPFIHSFSEVYRRMVLDPSYAPSPTQLVDDYREHNPTRNRPLDLWPLFVHLHGPEAAEGVEERDLIKSRPAFHYRLPNCELASDDWTPAVDYQRWLQVERLAEDASLLAQLSTTYLATRDLPLRLQRGDWVQTVQDRMDLQLQAI